MKRICSSIVMALALTGAMATSTLATSLNFSSSVGATIDFDGAGQFDFGDGTDGFDFRITSLGTASNLGGNISGPFTIDPSIVVVGGLETASVSGAGTFSIYDGADTLTGQLSFVNIATFGTLSGLNTSATVNLTNISYDGLNTALQALNTGTNGVVTATFQFSPPKTLTELANEANSASYSGKVSVPEPMSLLLLGSGLAGLGLVRRKFGRG